MTMMTMVKISSGWNGATNGLDGETYPDQDAALRAVEQLVGEGCIVVEVDGETPSWLVYPDQDAADSDSDGGHPDAACAGIAEVAS